MSRVKRGVTAHARHKKVKAKETEEDTIKARDRKAKSRDKIYKEYKIKHQAKFKWCKNPETNKCLPFDCCIEELKLIIEIDGMQHFKQVMNWKCPKDQQDRDIYKMNKAIDIL